MFQTLEKTEDVAVSIVQEKWILDPVKKSLSIDNRPENCGHVVSLGKEAVMMVTLKISSFLC